TLESDIDGPPFSIDLVPEYAPPSDGDLKLAEAQALPALVLPTPLSRLSADMSYCGLTLRGLTQRMFLWRTPLRGGLSPGGVGASSLCPPLY
ncbi:hypothetical protein Tco_0827655, partial [Tanacetum coccineum]